MTFCSFSCPFFAWIQKFVATPNKLGKVPYIGQLVLADKK